MAVPKRAQLLNRNRVKKELPTTKCQRQFPDCPEKINESCKSCPFYAK